MTLRTGPHFALLTATLLLADCQCDIGGPADCLSDEDCPPGFYCHTETDLCTADDSGVEVRADAASWDTASADTANADMASADTASTDGRRRDAASGDAEGADAAPLPSLTVNITPVDGSSGVPVDVQIVLTFSAAMNQSSVEDDGFCLAGAGTCLAGTFSWNSQSTVVFVPDAQLAGATEHTATVRAGCSSNAGRALEGTGGPGCSAPEQCVRFTTSDGTPPTVTVAPVDGSSGVAPGQRVSLLFSEPMQQSSVEQRFNLTQGGAPVPGSITWTSPSVMEYQPASALRCSTSYLITLAAGATDLSGIELAGSGGASCAAPAVCAGFVTRSTQRVCQTCTGDCFDVLVAESAGCGCATSVPAPNCDLAVSYCVPCGCSTCPCGYECYFERQQDTYDCNCADVCR